MKQSESRVFYTWGWQKSYRIIERGQGLYLYDSDGNRYLDAIGGSHLVSIGHGVPEIADAIAQQARNFCFLSKGEFTSQPVERLASVVAEMAPKDMDRSCFVTSGSDANEIAIQIAHYYHRERGKENRSKVIGRKCSYHGRTVATQALSGNMTERQDSLSYQKKSQNTL